MRVEPLGLRVGLGAAAVVVGGLTALVDPGRPVELAWVAVGVVVFAAGMWTPWLPAPLLAVVVAVPAVLAVRNGQLEQVLFLCAMAGLVVAWFEISSPQAIVAGLVCAVAPIVAFALLPPRENFGVLSWVLGVGVRGGLRAAGAPPARPHRAPAGRPARARRRRRRRGAPPHRP